MWSALPYCVVGTLERPPFCGELVTSERKIRNYIYGAGILGFFLELAPGFSISDSHFKHPPSQVFLAGQCGIIVS
jgi:hypothetical protein